MLVRIALALVLGASATAPAWAFGDLGGFESTQRFAQQYVVNKQKEKAASERAALEMQRVGQSPQPARPQPSTPDSPRRR